jgi:NO-binding membrane sensor protein with MHYT domain
MAAKYILVVVALAFLIAGTARLVRDGGRPHPQSRTWLLIAAIFGGVSAWLFYAT